jgi:hypothetical protein
MTWGQKPAFSWMRWLERRFGWLAIPNLAIILVTLQAIGTLFVMLDPVWSLRLALIPEAVRAGEYWRLVTFLALPLSMGVIWALITLWFLYFVINMIETEWGAFKTTLYVLVSVLLMIGFSFLFNYPITQISEFESTLFLAAATLFPETEIRIYFFIPAKLKWLGWIAGVVVLYHFALDDWMDRFYLIAIYANYLLFFGPALYSALKQAYRRWDYKTKTRR